MEEVELIREFFSYKYGIDSKEFKDVVDSRLDLTGVQKYYLKNYSRLTEIAKRARNEYPDKLSDEVKDYYPDGCTVEDAKEIQKNYLDWINGGK